MILVFLCLVSVVRGGPATESYKDQFCTDPRTGQKHDAYTEWADAYSCTRHRCQPGGRNLAIYTVGCKRIEAPESAIECEEVVEDTNMQFPFCCTRLRCLVLVRGEVWTRVLGQPWETLPAAPWSHMYKMKRPPPADGGLPKPGAEQGPVYEIAEGGDREVMRSKAEGPDCGDEPHTAPGPDIVIALGTHTDEDTKALSEGNSGRHKKGRKPSLYNSFLDDDRRAHDTDLQDLDENTASDKPADSSDERFFADAYGVTQKVSFKSQHQPWTEIPSSQWNEQDPADSDSNKDTPYQQEYQPKQEKGNLQALVDAIGSRMKDIESVVEKMTKKVHHDNTLDKRFSTHNRGKYLRTVGASEAPLYLEDPKLNGYFSDASNGVIRGKGPKEPAETFMAVVDTRRRTPDKDTEDKKHKKHTHKRKGKHHKKHHTTKKRFNRLTSAESDKNVVSDDSSGAVAGN